MKEGLWCCCDKGRGLVPGTSKALEGRASHLSQFLELFHMHMSVLVAQACGWRGDRPMVRPHLCVVTKAVKLSNFSQGHSHKGRAMMGSTLSYLQEAAFSRCRHTKQSPFTLASSNRTPVYKWGILSIFFDCVFSYKTMPSGPKEEINLLIIFRILNEHLTRKRDWQQLFLLPIKQNKAWV